MAIKVTPIHLEKVSSTNTYAKENFSQFHPQEITRVTADEQTAGRGRFNRSWVSPSKENLYLTYCFTTKKDGMEVNNLSQILALSIAKLLDQEGLKPQIKWPNDVLINGKKIAGILCETIDLNDHFGVILGTGINVNMGDEALAGIDQPATSFLAETGKTHKLSSLLTSLETFFLRDYEIFKTDGFKPFFPAYNGLLVQKGKTVTLKQGKEMITGTVHSLNPDGRLNLELPDGSVQTLSSGEIKK
ncbi:MAG: biotin--[acetyl-CoA-carboxylase] ligase [Chlamydiia bacterium]|nr:biotin--[acetyl-CoA-carboxylase] ligase [Chlamydiia bacterium]